MWVKRLDDLMFVVLYLAQPYQLKRQARFEIFSLLYYLVRGVFFRLILSTCAKEHKSTTSASFQVKSSEIEQEIYTKWTKINCGRKARWRRVTRRRPRTSKNWMGAAPRPAAQLLFRALGKLCLDCPDHDLIPGRNYRSSWKWVSLRTTPSTLSVSPTGQLKVRWS